MEELSSLRLAKAKYNFKGKNNDELCFKKGDLIIVTQPIDSDWWEGTFNGHTGWFPVSYVSEIRVEQLSDAQKHKLFGSRSVLKPGAGPQSVSSRNYHSEVLAGMIETEIAFVSELDQSWNSLIQPIGSANVVTKEEFSILASNYEEILTLHRQFLGALKDCAKQALNVRRVGKVFLDHAPSFRLVYERYASNHPRAVRILMSQKRPAQSHKTNTPDLGRFIAERTAGSANAGINLPTHADMQMFLPLTTALALPLTRLEKMPLTLRELDRHLEEGHFDRGDTQRAFAVFKQLIADCQELRLLRELELDIANAVVSNLPPALEAVGPENRQKLAGGVVFLSPVKLATGTDVVDRIFVLYPSSLVILSAENDISKLTFEAEFPLTHLYVDKNLPSPELAKRFLHAFSLFSRPLNAVAVDAVGSKSPQDDCFVVVCSSASLCNRWIDLLSSVASSESSASDENKVKSNGENRRSASMTFPNHSFSDNSISEHRNSTHASKSKHIGLPLSPLACNVGSLPISAAMLASGMQSSSTLAALAPASPHPHRKPNAITSALSSAAQVATASTPLARKRYALANTVNMSGHPPQSHDVAEDQQLMSVIESFVSAPQMVPIGAAQNTAASPSNSHIHVNLQLNGSGASHSHMTLEPVMSHNRPPSSVTGANISRNSASIRPDLLIAEEEKLLLEELKPLSETGNSTTSGLQERTLVDAVYSLWDYVAELRTEVARLKAQ